MSNLSSDSKHITMQTTAQTEQTKVLITFSDGSRFQYEITIPSQTPTDLQYWYSSQKILIAYEFSPSTHSTGTCVSTVPTYINMANVSQIREVAL